MSDHVQRALSGQWRDEYKRDNPVKPHSDETDQQRFERALAIWRERKSLVGSPAELYLRRRLINPDVLLWPPGGWCAAIAWSEDAVRTPRAARPAMICAINDARTGLVVGIQRIFFGRDGNVALKPDGKKEKQSLGRLSGNAAMLCHWPDPAGRWGIAEGIESALAASLLTRIPTWAAVAAFNMPRVTPPSWARRITIFADHDKSGTGIAYAAEAYKAWRARPGVESVRVLCHQREGGDVADVLTEVPYAGA